MNVYFADLKKHNIKILSFSFFFVMY